MRKNTLLIFLFCFFSITLMGCHDPNSLESQIKKKVSERAKEKYHCGKMGKNTVKFEKRYASSAEYQGVSYWEGDPSHYDKGCDDAFTAFYINVRWPTLEPDKMGVIEKDPNALKIGYHSVGNDTGNKRNPNGMNDKKDLYIDDFLWEKQVNHPRPGNKPKPKIVWREDLGLYQASIDIPEGADRGVNQLIDYVFWHEDKKKKVDFISYCSLYIKGNPRCQSTYYPPHDDNLYVNLYHFNVKLLKDWRRMVEVSEALFQSFIIKGE